MAKFQTYVALAIVAFFSATSVSAKDLTWGEWFSTLGGLLPTREQIKRCTKEYAAKPDLAKIMAAENVLVNFDKVDKNGDGEVTAAEMIAEGIEQGLSDDCAKGMKLGFDDRFKFIDLNKDGKFKRDDAETIAKCTKEAQAIPELAAQFQTPGATPKPEDAYKFFDKFDQNGDNEVTEDECVKWATDSGLSPECASTLRQQFQANLPFLDVDKNGKLTKPDLDQGVKCAKQFLAAFPEYVNLDPEKVQKQWWTPEGLLELWPRLDVDNDGAVGPDEVTKFFTNNGVDADCAKGMKEMFEVGLKWGDDNGDGKISKDEL